MDTGAIKEKGQVFTPAGIVTMILDSVNYNGRSVLEKSIMEPSFGNGAFLIEIISRIIKEGKAEGKTAQEISDIAGRYVYGFEKDRELYKEAIQRLNGLLASHKIPLPDWKNLICGDALLLYPQHAGKMDICVGNPPYVRIHNIGREYRDIIKSFTFTDGTINLYVVFYEIGIKMLKNNSGMLSYISPNSFMRNDSQKKFRSYLIENGLLSAIYDFKDSKIFGADTYTCICILDNDTERGNAKVVEYREYDMYEIVGKNTVSYGYFRSRQAGSAWNLSSKKNLMYLEQNAERTGKLKDIATVQNGISTNRDSVYIGKAYLDKNCTLLYAGKHTDKSREVYFNGHKIESGILRRCVKASKYDGRIPDTYILFPYKENGNAIYEPYTESELKNMFPKAYAYLLENKENLKQRDMDAGADWFLFARSQGIVNSGYKKLVFKHIISRSSDVVDVYTVDEDVAVYSKLYITAERNGSVDEGRSYEDKLEEIRKMLASPDFHRYCVLSGKDMQGGYVSVSSVVVKNYGITAKDFS